MRVLYILSLLLILMSCKELGEAIQTYEEPIIEDLVLFPKVVNPGDTVTAVVTATNPEKGILIYAWEAPDGGDFIPPVDEETVFWIAPFAGNDYRIRAVVRNDEKATLTKSVTVQSLDKPLVQIVNPDASNELFYAQGEEIDVTASAYHDNHLSKVWLFIDDIAIDSLDWSSSNTYQFTYIPDFSIVGEIEIRIIAEVFNQPGNIGSDFIKVNIQGILPKTGNL